MSKARAVTETREKSKTKSNPTTSVPKKTTTSTSSITTTQKAQAPIKKPLLETKSKPIRTNDHVPTTTNVSNTQKGRIHPTSNVLKPKTSNKLTGGPIKHQAEKGTSSQAVRAKTATIKPESIRSSPTNAKTSRKQAKPNAVLNTYHNVTVSSPPSKRKNEHKSGKAENIPKPEPKLELEPEPGPKQEKQDPMEHIEKRTRTRTRTLDPDEIVVLRNDSAKQRVEAEIQSENDVTEHLPIRDAIAFEVNFEAPKKLSTHSREPSNVREKQENILPTEDGDANYSDDFESYESDFETGSSSPTALTDSEDYKKDGDNNSNVSDEGNELSKSEDDLEEDDEESEFTQYPITVIQREKELERKLDSGNYEMHLNKRGKPGETTTLNQFDSLDTFSGNTSEQLDSGISSYGTTSQQINKNDPNCRVFYGGYANFNSHPMLSPRGLVLMSMVQFDTLTFTLFDIKPISYDVFMQTYGKLNTTQSSTQTNEHRMASETQTEVCEVRSMWTQHPAQFDLQTVQKLTHFGRLGTQNCCGDLTEMSGENRLSKKDKLDEALLKLVDFSQDKVDRGRKLYGLRKSIDFERLQAFLLNASATMLRVLDCERTERDLEAGLEKTKWELSCHYSLLNTNILNALRVVRIFSSPRHSLVISVHESLPEADVYRGDFSNLMMVWSTNDCSKPIRLLSSWSEVCRAEICIETPDIVVCGLRDGSVAMWDLRETYSFCSKLDGYLTHFAATQSIVPLWNGENDKSEKIMDMGAVIDVKSFRARPKPVGISSSFARYKSIQFASLNDVGILTIWTLVETEPKENAPLPIESNSKSNTKSRTVKTPATRFEYSSPWARVKLIQSTVCNLRDYLERGILKAQTNFDRTKLLFEKNIYKDEVLRELNEQSNQLQGATNLPGLRFTCIDTGCESVYVCSNQNFILICSKTLKADKFRKISINEDRFLFPTALRVLTNEDFLAVGLSNGSVMILNCNQGRIMHKKTKEDEKGQRKNGNGKICKTNETHDMELDTGKSCAIQNIILNERRSFENDISNDFETSCVSRPTTAACIELISNKKKPFELRVFDQQTILSGSMMRKHLVQTLELSSDGWRLFSLSDGVVRTYDFYLDHEVLASESTDGIFKIMDITAAATNRAQQNLIALTKSGEVEVHVLKQ